MPSGKTHDKIAIRAPFVLGAVATGAMLYFQLNPALPIIAGAATFISGWWLSPDLDIHSEPYKRWGLLRFIWLPYRKLIPKHRSFFSHGILVGTLLRLAWLALWLSPIVGLLYYFDWLPLTPQELLTAAKTYQLELLTALVGLEFGAAVHYVPDWVSTRIKRWKRRR